MKTCSTDLGNQKVTIDDLKQQVVNANADASGKDDTISSLTNDLKKCNANNGNSDGLLSTCQTKLATAEGKVGRLESTVKGQKEQIGDFSTERGSWHAKELKLQDQIRAKKRELQNCKNNAANAGSLKRTISDLESELAACHRQSNTTSYSSYTSFTSDKYAPYRQAGCTEEKIKRIKDIVRTSRLPPKAGLSTPEGREEFCREDIGTYVASGYTEKRGWHKTRLQHLGYQEAAALGYNHTR